MDTISYEYHIITRYPYFVYFHSLSRQEILMREKLRHQKGLISTGAMSPSKVSKHHVTWQAPGPGLAPGLASGQGLAPGQGSATASGSGQGEKEIPIFRSAFDDASENGLGYTGKRFHSLHPFLTSPTRSHNLPPLSYIYAIHPFPFLLLTGEERDAMVLSERMYYLRYASDTR